MRPLIADPLAFNDALGTLGAYSLIARHTVEKTIHVHRLVQAVLQDALEEGEQRIWAERAMLAMNAVFPRVEQSTWMRCEHFLLQAQTGAQFIKTYQLTGEEAGRLLYEIASYLQDRALYSEACKCDN